MQTLEVQSARVAVQEQKMSLPSTGKDRSWYTRLSTSSRISWPNQNGKFKFNALTVVATSFLLVTLLAASLATVQRSKTSNFFNWLSFDLVKDSIMERSISASATSGRNYTGQILQELRRNGTIPCHQEHTNQTRIQGLPEGGVVTLTTNVLHQFLLVSLTSLGTARCAGGDYYETDLASSSWRSRPPIEDLGNGSYGVSFLVPNRFAGDFNFSAHLLFDNYHGLGANTWEWMIGQRTILVQLRFVRNESLVLSNATSRQAQDGFRSLRRCELHDFTRSEWSGRWSRGWYNETCQPDNQGRFEHCTPKEHERCDEGWCDGRVSRLESNGWAYSAHCAFHIYESQEAWDCLNGRWLLFWGDSNFQDTIRNILLFILKVPVPHWTNLKDYNLQRSFEAYFVNPQRPDESIHISSIFNGHHIEWENNEGLDSLQDAGHREWIARHFEGKSSLPDTIIMTSGLHDGKRFPLLSNYVDSVDRALDFWETVFRNVTGPKKPRFVYKTAIAPAGTSRGMISNPWRMEVFNKIMVERLQEQIPGVVVLDAFDLTFPWHYDHKQSDGGHYGRPPLTNLPPWYGQPHEYFVDIMLAHILLNAICHPIAMTQ